MFPPLIHMSSYHVQSIKCYMAFKAFEKHILIATDIFGHGIDVEHVNINYDCPLDTGSYPHHVGHAGWFGTKGLAITCFKWKWSTSNGHPSPHTAPTVVPHTPHPPSSPTISLALVKSHTAHPDHPWLQAILDHKQCPSFIQSIDSTMTLIFSHITPDNMQ